MTVVLYWFAGLSPILNFVGRAQTETQLDYLNRTGVTFTLIYKPKFALPYWIPGAISITAWLIAPYRLYRQQQIDFDTLIWPLSIL